MQVVPYFYPAWAYGGIPRVVYELSREMVRKGHDVTVYTTDVFDENTRCAESGGTVRIDGIRVRYFRNVSNSLAYHSQLFLPRGMIQAVKTTIGEFDVIHCHGHRNFLNSIVHHYARKSGKKFILSGHGTVVRIERRIYLKRIFDGLFGDRVLRDAVHFVAVSEYEVGQYAEMGIGRSRVDVIYNGIDIDAYAELPAFGGFRKKYGLMGKKMVLYLGKITPRKGIDFLVKAFSQLRSADTVLVIAGNDMGFKRRVDDIVRETGTASRVLFTGLLTGRDKLSAYVDADVLAYPAIHEIFGLVPFEAIMCGTPVIVTNDCGCGDIIGGEDIGQVVKYGDVAGLSRAIDGIFGDSAAAAERTQRGKAFILRTLNWQLIAQKYLSLYENFVL